MATYRDYKQIYDQVTSVQGRNELGDDPARIDAVVAKLSGFTNDYTNWKKAEKPSNQQIFDLPLKQILHNAITVFVDIVQDLHKLMLRRHEISGAALRRGVTQVFTKKDRRMYVGIWVVLLAFVIYFLDASV